MRKIKACSILAIAIILIIIGANKAFALESEYQGFTVLGVIQIPKTNIKYPILEKVTLKSIKVGVAKLYGVDINQQGNVVIIGHNYRSEEFFSKNKELEQGDEIYITSRDDVTEKYIVYNKFQTAPEDTSFYQMDTKGEKIITLSTNTDDTRERLIIQAKSAGVATPPSSTSLNENVISQQIENSNNNNQQTTEPNITDINSTNSENSAGYTNKVNILNNIPETTQIKMFTAFIFAVIMF